MAMQAIKAEKCTGPEAVIKKNLLVLSKQKKKNTAFVTCFNTNCQGSVP